MDTTFTQWVPPGFAEWLPWTQATTLAVSTLVQEDVPTIGAALLAVTGVISWQTGWLGCFLGIWLGDALLYLTARGIGRPLLDSKLARRFVSSDSVKRSEAWFESRGSWLLVTSRFVPGTRLPTYLAAGFLRLPFGRFLAITGVTVMFWTAAIFSLIHCFGASIGAAVKGRGNTVWVGLIIVVGLVVLIRILLRAVSGFSWNRIRASATRWTRWEFWPAWLFYAPVVLRYIQLSIRHRGFTVPCAANPSIHHGGMVGESKIATLQDLHRTSPDFTAEGWLIPAGGLVDQQSALAQLRARHSVELPFILKPDIGQRGVGVKLIRSDAEATACLETSPTALVLQRYVPGPFEAGVFYYRFPDQARGAIFAITEKVFPMLTGDGVHTVEELIWQDERARCMAAKYLERFEKRRDEVLAADEQLRLVEAGNHAQGCIFLDGHRLATPELTARIDEISRRIDGFFIGRYDVRYSSEEELKAGRGFQILELNGAAAEATNIYDARNTLVSAYRTLFRQWSLVFAIGAANRARGHRPSSPGSLWRTWRETSRQIAAYPSAD